MIVNEKEAARRIREHNRIHKLKEPNSMIISEILETAATMFDQLAEGNFQLVKHGRWLKSWIGSWRELNRNE